MLGFMLFYNINFFLKLVLIEILFAFIGVHSDGLVGLPRYHLSSFEAG